MTNYIFYAHTINTKPLWCVLAAGRTGADDGGGVPGGDSGGDGGGSGMSVRFNSVSGGEGSVRSSARRVFCACLTRATSAL